MLTTCSAPWCPSEAWELGIRMGVRSEGSGAEGLRTCSLHLHGWAMQACLVLLPLTALSRHCVIGPSADVGMSGNNDFVNFY